MSFLSHSFEIPIPSYWNLRSRTAYTKWFRFECCFDMLWLWKRCSTTKWPHLNRWRSPFCGKVTGGKSSQLTSYATTLLPCRSWPLFWATVVAVACGFASLHGLENTLGLDKTLDLRLTFRSTRVKVGLDPGAIRVQILLAKNAKHIGSSCCCGVVVGGRKMNWEKIMVTPKGKSGTWQCGATEGS